MELGGYEVVRLKPEIPRFAELVRGAKQICDSFLGKGLYSERQIDEICRRENCYFFTVLEGDKIEGIFCCYADDAGSVSFAEGIEGLTADTRIGVAQSVALKSEARRKGLSAAMLDHATGILFREEKVKLILALAWVQGEKIPARKHLERCRYHLLTIRKRPWASCEELICPACGQRPCVCDGAVYVKERNDDE